MGTSRRVARFGWSDHLVRLVARGSAAAARLEQASAEARARVAASARPQQARCSARLDASPLSEDTAAAVDARGGTADLPADARRDDPGARGGGWAEALKLDGMPTEAVVAVEYANLLRAWDAEPELADRLFVEPLEVLTELHGRICEGLVDPRVVGRLRTSEQDVHDGAQGQVVYRPPEPARLPDLLADLAAWLGHDSAEKPGLVVAGIVHERLLEWQPYEAANGRVARAAARLVLRSRGIDPLGTSVPEAELIADPLGYAREVGATMRRRGDLTRWLERDIEVRVRALERAADSALGHRPPAPQHALAALGRLAPSFTLAEYAGVSGADRERARSDLVALERAGLVVPEPGTAGLKLRQRASPGASPLVPGP